MKINFKQAMLIAFLSALIGFIIGWDSKRYQIRDRVLRYDAKTDCYSQQDLEYIVFGESQL